MAMLDFGAGGRGFRSGAAHHELTVDLLQICAEPLPRRGRTAKRDQIAALGMCHLSQGAPGAAAVRDSTNVSAAAGAMTAGLQRAAA